MVTCGRIILHKSQSNPTFNSFYNQLPVDFCDKEYLFIACTLCTILRNTEQDWRKLFPPKNIGLGLYNLWFPLPVLIACYFPSF